MEYTNDSRPEQSVTLLYLLLFVLLLALPDSGHAVEKISGFDHFTTGFPLTGRHEMIDCSECHIAGQFSGTPLECGLCHDNVRAPGKHLQHFTTSNFCDDCHTEHSWKGARFDHGDIQAPCQSCHNNVVAVGKSASHIASSEICEDCHNTISFDHVGRVDHVSVIGSCSSCHNGLIATGKPPGHIITSDECNECHTTYTWDAEN